MIHILAGVITFVCTFGGAQVATLIESLLPPSHLPFDGLIRVSSAPVRFALENLDK